MITAVLTATVLMSGPTSAPDSPICRPAVFSVGAVSLGPEPVLDERAMSEMLAYIRAAGSPRVSVRAESQDPQSREATLLVLRALAEGGVRNVDFVMRTGPKDSGFKPVAGTPPLSRNARVTVGCEA